MTKYLVDWQIYHHYHHHHHHHRQVTVDCWLNSLEIQVESWRQISKSVKIAPAWKLELKAAKVAKQLNKKKNKLLDSPTKLTPCSGTVFVSISISIPGIDIVSASVFGALHALVLFINYNFMITNIFVEYVGVTSSIVAIAVCSQPR